MIMKKPGQKTLKDIRDSRSAIRKVERLSGRITELAASLRPYRQIRLFGCGSSYWTAVIAAEWIRRTGREAAAFDAADIIAGNAPLSPDALYVALSQSGRTSETIKAAQLVKTAGGQLLALVNPAASPLEQLAHRSIVLRAGREGVVATKTFDATLAALHILIRRLAGKNADIATLPKLYDRCERLDLSGALKLLSGTDRAYALGLDADYGLAGETSVKFGEAADLQVTPLIATEASHGPKANMSGIPVLIFATESVRSRLYDQIGRELTAAGASVIMIGGSPAMLSRTFRVLLPGRADLKLFAAIKVVHFLAWGLALAKGLDPDRPRALKKFVIRKGI